MTDRLVTNRPSSGTKRPVPVRSNFPEASKPERAMAAGVTLFAAFLKSGGVACATVAAGVAEADGEGVAAAMRGGALMAGVAFGAWPIGSACFRELHLAMPTTMPSTARKKMIRDWVMRCWLCW